MPWGREGGEKRGGAKGTDGGAEREGMEGKLEQGRRLPKAGPAATIYCEIKVHIAKSLTQVTGTRWALQGERKPVAQTGGGPNTLRT